MRKREREAEGKEGGRERENRKGDCHGWGLRERERVGIFFFNMVNK